MSRELISQLKKLKNGDASPRAAWLESNRAVLLSQIKNTVNKEVGSRSSGLNNIWTAMTVFMPQQVVFNVVRPVAVLLVVTMVASSGWVATVDAAYNALPGDWLYPAKRVGEKATVTMASITGGKTAEVKARTELVKRRATEAKQIVKSTDPKKEQKVKKVMDDLKKEIKNVNTNLDEIKSAGTGVATIANLAKDVKTNTDQVKTVLQEVKTELLITASSTAVMAAEVSEAKDLTKDTGVKVVEMLVTKHLEGGDAAVSQEEVKQVIGSALTNIANELDATKLSVDTAKAAVDTVKAEAKIEAAAQLIAGTTATGTEAAAAKVLTEKISTVAEEAKQAVAQTKTVLTKTDEKIDAAAAALEKGDLTKALDLVKEVNTDSKEQEKLSDKTITSVQSVTPVVTVVKDETKVVPIVTTTIPKVEEAKPAVTTTVPAPVVNPTNITTEKK